MAERPRRIQLSRRRGWRMPPNTVKVDRSTKWGNRYRPGGSVFRAKGFGKVRDASEAVELFRRLQLPSMSDVARLRGQNLGCWCGLCERHRDGKPFDVECPDCAPCHADALGQSANQPIRDIDRGNP